MNQQETMSELSELANISHPVLLQSVRRQVYLQGLHRCGKLSPSDAMVGGRLPQRHLSDTRGSTLVEVRRLVSFIAVSK